MSKTIPQSVQNAQAVLDALTAEDTAHLQNPKRLRGFLPALAKKLEAAGRDHSQNALLTLIRQGDVALDAAQKSLKQKQGKAKRIKRLLHNEKILLRPSKRIRSFEE